MAEMKPPTKNYIVQTPRGVFEFTFIDSARECAKLHKGGTCWAADDVTEFNTQGLSHYATATPIWSI